MNYDGNATNKFRDESIVSAARLLEGEKVRT